MKYAILVGDGMADYPFPERGNKTALQIADTPNMDFIASEGTKGIVKTIPNGMDAGSDVAVLSILGYSLSQCYTGRGPLEAIGMDIPLGDSDIAFRCNLITEEEGRIKDYSSGHIKSEEAEGLINALNEETSYEGVEFYAGIGYRNLLLLRSYNTSFEEHKEIGCAPPHEITGAPIEENIPKEGILRDIILTSKKILEKHKKRANMVWIWGGGRKPKMSKFEDIYGVTGSVIAAVYIIKGVGRCADLDIIDVPGASGYIDTNYEGKADYALRSLHQRDFVFVHVEAPDEASHIGEIDMKVKAIEYFDALVVGRVLKGLEAEFADVGYRILVLPDHYTPVSLRKHTREAVPFAIYEYAKGKSKKEGVRKGEVGVFDEISARNLRVLEARELMPLLFS